MDYKLESFTFADYLNLEGVIEHVFDEVCDKYDVEVLNYEHNINHLDDYAEYKNVKLSNGMIIEFEVFYNDEENDEEPWTANVWILKESEESA